MPPTTEFRLVTPITTPTVCRPVWLSPAALAAKRWTRRGRRGRRSLWCPGNYSGGCLGYLDRHLWSA